MVSRATAFALALWIGCKKEPAKQPPSATPTGDAGPTADAAPAVAIDEPRDAGAPAPATRDGGVVDYSAVVTAAWPSALEVEMHSKTVAGIEGTVTYPIFRSRPPELG